jgi:hypothetical protein
MVLMLCIPFSFVIYRTISDVIEKLSVLIALRNASESASGTYLRLLLNETVSFFNLNMSRSTKKETENGSGRSQDRFRAACCEEIKVVCAK